MTGAAITGSGMALPPSELSNADLAVRLGVDEAGIFTRTGIRTRRVAGEGETTASLGTEAAQGALTASGVPAEDLDMVIVATSTPDYQMPSAASLVQTRLNAARAGAYDINAACSGFLYALAQGSALVEAGMAERVLVVGADTLTRVTDATDPKTSIIFGDGAGAVVVERVDEPSRLGPFKLLSDGSLAPLLYIPPEEGVMRMRGREVYRHAVEGMAQAVCDILEIAGYTIEDVDALVAHQANARILEAVATRLGLKEERVLTNIERVGNTSAASIPIELALASEEGLLADDDVVIVTAFGAGFAWGAGVVRWGSGHPVAQAVSGAGTDV
ncbi:ketoacyl-ACP synthase III [soil metagenome]|nr:ketoacyl-ACP synthase III [Actinomycetota bacterium]